MAAKKQAAKKQAAKKSAAKRPAATKKSGAKRAPAKKTIAKKAPALKKPAARKDVPRKPGVVKPAGKQPAAPSKPAAPAKVAPAKPAAPAKAAPPAPVVKPVAPVAAASEAPKPAAAPKPVAAAKPTPAAAGPKHGGISDDAVKAATNRGWDDWFKLIDDQNGATLDHRDIVAIVAPHLQKSEWWAQMISVAYEQARGLRKKHEKPDGFQVGASRVLDVSVSRIYAAFFDDALRARWLSDPVTIKKATMDRSLRMAWKDNTPIDVHLFAKGESRASVAVQHGKIQNEATAAERKAYWKAALERLERMLIPR